MADGPAPALSRRAAPRCPGCLPGLLFAGTPDGRRSRKSGRKMTEGKKYTAAAARVDRTKLYDVQQAVALVRSAAYAKFNETLEVALRLGVDPKHADQMVRGTVVLPHGTGATIRVAVVASGEKVREAEEAGADVVGGDDLVAKIQTGFLDFEALVATPDMMRSLGRLGKVLGPRGLMPNPKAGTVTFEVGKAVKELKAGKIEFRVDKTGIVHAPVGKLSFGEKALIENTEALLLAVDRAKPAAAKGKYVQSCTLTSTMGPGVPVDTATLEKLAGRTA